MRNVLVIANQTLLGDHLRDALRGEMATGPVRVLLLVPASNAHTDALTWDENRAWQEAEARLRVAMAELAELGIEVRGRVGGADAYAAALDRLREERFDVVIVSTLPHGLSRWLGLDLPSRLARATDIPVRHVVGEPVPA